MQRINNKEGEMKTGAENNSTNTRLLRGGSDNVSPGTNSAVWSVIADGDKNANRQVAENFSDNT